MTTETFDFDEDWYLGRYPDIKRAVDAGKLASGLIHYELHGRAEGRKPMPPIPSFSPMAFLNLDFDQISAIRWALMDLRAGRPPASDDLKTLSDLGIAHIVAGRPVLTQAGEALTKDEITVARLRGAAERLAGAPLP